MTAPEQGTRGFRYRRYRETVVAAKIDEAFAFLAHPDAMVLLDVPWTGIRLVSGPPRPLGLASEREYIFRWSRIPVYLRVRVTEYDCPYRLSIDQVLGPWRRFRNVSTLRSFPGGTVIGEETDVVAMPGVVDHVVHRLKVARQLDAIDAYRHGALLRHLGTPELPRHG